jgi:molecular chaperone GrpE
MLLEARTESDRVKAEADEYRSMLQRLQADFLNYKRRVEAEQQTRADAMRGESIAAFLPIVDDLERALGHVPSEARGQSWLEGFGLIQRNLTAVFERLGLKRVGEIGEVFDPRLHEALAYEERHDQPEGHIAAVHRAGYQLGERVVRPAQVVVARAASEQRGGGRQGWPGHQTRRPPGNGAADPADLGRPRSIDRK